MGITMKTSYVCMRVGIPFVFPLLLTLVVCQDQGAQGACIATEVEECISITSKVMMLGEQAKNHKSICAAHAAVKACVDHCPTLKGQVDKASLPFAEDIEVCSGEKITAILGLTVLIALGNRIF